MQTILGSNGQIGYELTKVLYQEYTKDIRLVSRHPKRINPTDQLFPADLLDFKQTVSAIEHSEIVYFTVGLPMNTVLWEQEFMPIIKNVIKACKLIKSKLVFFDNTYMYPKNERPQSETTLFSPIGRKAMVRAEMARLVQSEIDSGELTAMICRAPEFYGPGKTQSITNTLVIDKIRECKTAIVPVNSSVLRSLIWTPDASRAMALLGNTPSAYGQTWHLPSDTPHSYQEMIKIFEGSLKRQVKYRVIPLWQFRLAKLFSQKVRELAELLPRYGTDNLFISDKFKNTFPDFHITTFEEGVTLLVKAQSLDATD